MDPITLGLVGGGVLGGLKDLLGIGEYNRQKKIQGATTRFSPWTHMQAAAPNAPNLASDLLSGVTAGGAFGQGIAKMGLLSKLANQAQLAGSLANIPSTSWSTLAGTQGDLGGATNPLA